MSLKIFPPALRPAAFLSGCPSYIPSGLVSTWFSCPNVGVQNRHPDGDCFVWAEGIEDRSRARPGCRPNPTFCVGRDSGKPTSTAGRCPRRRPHRPASNRHFLGRFDLLAVASRHGPAVRASGKVEKAPATEANWSYAGRPAVLEWFEGGWINPCVNHPLLPTERYDRPARPVFAL